MKFLSFCDSFFIVKKIAKMHLFQLSETHTSPIALLFTWLDSLRDSLSIEQLKGVLTVGKFGVNRPPMSQLINLGFPLKANIMAEGQFYYCFFTN